MDILKQELLKKRQSLSEETGGRKVFKRSEIEQRRIQKLREEEKRDAEAKRLRQDQNQNNSNSSGPNSSSNPNYKLDSSNSKPESAVGSSSKTPISDEQKIDALNLPKQEMEGEVKMMLAEMVVLQKLLIEWNQELDEMTETEKRTAKGKSTFATFKQCARYLNPLFKFCRKKVLPDDIRQALMLVVKCCMERERYPTMPSKAVEFNSLANGSDLHALLAQEQRRTAAAAAQIQEEEDQDQDRLLLMPPPPRESD
ncbi:unnamed protein product [Lactuca saligna]|uniref:Pre-mRNA-splicing factor 18 n=1 Tax=Lactuca saligna TaxID=75948 RepID=A0AA35Z9T7_LACSI|nr:unnamed protein product [Lactuca saligna]